MGKGRNARVGRDLHLRRRPCTFGGRETPVVIRRRIPARKGVAMLEKDVTCDLHLSEDDSDTIAYAVLNLRGDHFEAVGKARRNPTDPPMPVIGEELAIARAQPEEKIMEELDEMFA